MLNACAEGILVRYTIISVKFNGILDFSGTVLTVFRYAYHEGVENMSVRVAH